MPAYVICNKDGLPLSVFEKKYAAKFWWQKRLDKNSLRIFVETKVGNNSGFIINLSGNRAEPVPNLIEKNPEEYFEERQI